MDVAHHRERDVVLAVARHQDRRLVREIDAEWHMHDYGKAQVKHNRKMGHITVLTDDPARTAADLEATGCWSGEGDQ